MAKTNTVQIKLVSSADTGFFYVTKKNARTQTGKLELKKYDPVVRKHVAVPRSQDQVARRDAPAGAGGDRGREFHPVAPCPLGRIQRHIGRAQQRLRCDRLLAAAGNADADGQSAADRLLRR